MPQSRTPRHGVRGTERRTEIVRAALEVIAERGYRGASIAAVAERVGLTQQGLLHYFPSKEALLTAVLEQRDLWDATGVLAATAQGRAGWASAHLATLVEYNAMRRGLVQTFSSLLGESVTDGHPAADWFAERYRLVREGVAASLRAEFGERLPGSGLTPEQAAPLVTAVMDGLQYQWLLDPGAVDMAPAFTDFLAALTGRPSEPGADPAADGR